MDSSADRLGALQRELLTAFFEQEHGRVRIDPIEEILVNKLTAAAARSEERDLVDLFCLERAGYRAEQALGAALAKDGGCTPGALAWVLSQVNVPEDAVLAGGISGGEMRVFLTGLVKRLRAAAIPAR